MKQNWMHKIIDAVIFLLEFGVEAIMLDASDFLRVLLHFYSSASMLTIKKSR